MFSELEKNLGYTFQNKRYLENALSHSSYANEKWKSSQASNERLEFVGDSVLGFVTAEHLFRKHQDLPEGDLTRIRADLVCETNLARVAKKLNLGKFLLLGHGEEHGGGRERNSILADAMESVLAATYLDGGFEEAKNMVFRLILEDAPEKLRNLDFKTVLQELVQRKKNQLIAYQLLAEEGPDHHKVFRVNVTINEEIVGYGEGSSKKRAEQAAAEKALEDLFPGCY